MVECVRMAWNDDAGFFGRLGERYGLLQRIRASCDKQGVTVVAFGLGDHECRVVMEGASGDVVDAIRGIRVGTHARARFLGVFLELDATQRSSTSRLEDAVVWAHQAAEDAGLASPWTSHRDLMGFRHAEFFDADAVRERVDIQAVHRTITGRPIPSPAACPVPGASVRHLMRVAGAVLGLLPSDRRTFALFIQVARACGWKTAELADALMVSKRRVRQLVHTPEQPVAAAMAALHDPRLAVVP